MCQFVKQEAEEKANEIKISAEEVRAFLELTCCTPPAYCRCLCPFRHLLMSNTVLTVDVVYFNIIACTEYDPHPETSCV